jgi:hypothetical protein
MPKKLTIKNLYKTEGINMFGISIDEWLTLDDHYEFLVYSNGHKWMYKLDRMPHHLDNKFKLTLNATANNIYTVHLGLNEIKVKRLFYMRVNELVEQHIEFVTNEIVSAALTRQGITAISNSININ